MMAFLTYDKCIFVTNNTDKDEEFPAQFPDMVQGDDSLVISQVKYVSVGGMDLAYIDEQGKVNIVLCPNNKPLLPFQIQLEEQAKIVSVSLNHTFICTKNNQIFCILQNILLKPQLVQFSDKIGEIIDMKSGNTSTIILTEDKRVYKIDYNQDQEEGFRVEHIKKLSNVVKISASYSWYLALEREDIDPIDKWDFNQVYKWFQEIGFDECSNIIKFKQIYGQQIVNADEEFLGDTLGIQSVSELYRIRFEISKVKEKSYKSMNLYGWGSNLFGQLGLVGNNVPDPKIIPLPELDEKDFITFIATGKRQSAFLTDQGQVWVTGNYQPEKVQKPQTAVEDSKEEEAMKRLQNVSSDEEWEKILAQEAKKKRKPKNQKNKINQMQKDQQNYRAEVKKQDDKEKSLKHRWQNLTQCYNQKAFGKNYQVDKIMIGSKYIMALSSYNFQKKQQRKNTYKEGMKFRGADKIIKKLAYDQKIYADKKFSVLYEDRFLGIIESDLTVFMESDVPYHRIQFFKCNGEIVWDRKNRFTTL